MKVLVSGASGLVGTAVANLLKKSGHEIVRLTRSASGPGSIHWDPAQNALDGTLLEGFDAVVHLAGENIASGRWSVARKAAIRDSRVQGTRLLCSALAKCERPPRVLASASAIGFYGARGDEVLTEDSSVGTGFLAEVCRDWEQATEPATRKGTRVAYLRFGVILSPLGGALQKMLLPFKLGGGGIIGNGKQYWSWVSLDDTAGAVEHVLRTESLQGAVNVVAPSASTNYEFTKTLGRVLSRPTILPMPAFAARLALGEMANELLLASARVEPVRLKSTGYAFQHPRLEDALRHLLNRPAVKAG